MVRDIKKYSFYNLDKRMLKIYIYIAKALVQEMGNLLLFYLPYQSKQWAPLEGNAQTHQNSSIKKLYIEWLMDYINWSFLFSSMISALNREIIGTNIGCQFFFV